jgi:23S rRNA (uracil1939-C5)-methyltransferase
MQPKTIVYISCDPTTQARDLAVITKLGYKVTAIQPVDMFPHTAHCENICLLKR